MFGRNYDPFELVKQIHNKNINDKNKSNKDVQVDKPKDTFDIEQIKNTSDKSHSSKEYKENKMNKSKKSIFYVILAVFIIIITVVITLGIVGYREYCSLPYESTEIVGDTAVSISATYNSKYHVAKIDLTIDEIVEDWQVRATNGLIKDDVKIECETSDGTVKKEFKFQNISLTEGEQITGSVSLDDTSLNDFVMIKDLLSGTVRVFYPPIINLDSKEREKLKQSYTSRGSLFGDLFLYYMMGGL